MNQPHEQKLSQKEFVLLSAERVAAYRALESKRSDRLKSTKLLTLIQQRLCLILILKVRYICVNNTILYLRKL